MAWPPSQWWEGGEVRGGRGVKDLDMSCLQGGGAAEPQVRGWCEMGYKGGGGRWRVKGWKDVFNKKKEDKSWKRQKLKIIRGGLTELDGEFCLMKQLQLNPWFIALSFVWQSFPSSDLKPKRVINEKLTCLKVLNLQINYAVDINTHGNHTYLSAGLAEVIRKWAADRYKW